MSIVESITRDLAGLRVITDADLLIPFSHDESFAPACLPMAVVEASSAEEVRRVLRWASGNQVRVRFIMTALGAVLLIGLARTMMGRKGRARRRRTAESAAPLHADLAAIDAAFAATDHPTAEQRADHWQARAHLAKQISDAVAREQGLP